MRKEEWFAFSAPDLERFIYTIETGSRVRKRHEFYLWAQGTLQSFIRHETLLCGLMQAPPHGMRCEVFSRAVLDGPLQQTWVEGDASMLSRLHRAWRVAGGLPLVVTADERSDTAEILRRQDVNAAVCHGFLPGPGHVNGPIQSGSFFAFLQVETPSPVRHTYITDLLLPHLHLAMQRVCSHEDELTPESHIDYLVLLSSRERQVLQWVREGKTNHEIGQILSISPFTVKNHVQRILRKLNVTNRAQAVARGLPEPDTRGKHGPRV